MMGATLSTILLTPIRAIKLRYVPLLLIYFSYGSSVFTAIAKDFWVKSELSMGASELIALAVWLSIPWTIKMIFGHMVDSITILGSNRKSYVLIGAFLIALSTIMMIGAVGNQAWMTSYLSLELIYILASLIGVIGFVLQDVVADTMTTEVVDRSQDSEAIKQELAMVQILARLSLGLAIFLTGWIGGKLAAIYSYETVFMISMFIPFLSIVGVTLIRLEQVDPCPLNTKSFYTSLGFAAFIVVLAINEVPFSQEIVFSISMIVVLFLLNQLMSDLDTKTIHFMRMSMIVIFVYRAMPGVGPGLQWWEIDVLGFDEAFFATLAAIGGGIALIGMWASSYFVIRLSIAKVLIFLTLISFVLSLPIIGLYYDLHTLLGIDARAVVLLDTALASPFDYIAQVLMLTLVAIYAPQGKRGTWFALMASFMNLALSAGGLMSKYLNKIFVVTREVRQDGEVIVSANYSELGALLWIVVIASCLIPIATILFCKPGRGRT